MPVDAWQRLKVRTNKPRFLGILKALAEWREIEAQQRDIPRNRVAKDETLFEIAAHPQKMPNILTVFEVSQMVSVAPARAKH